MLPDLSAERIPRGMIKSMEQRYEVASGGLSYNIKREVVDYLHFLPMLYGITFVDLLFSKSRSGTVNLLDVGCGKGNAISEIKSEFADRVNVYGLSAKDYRSGETGSNTNLVDYRIGDAHDIGNIFRGLKFDIVLSCYTFQYLADPARVLGSIYSLLEDDGVMFIHAPSLGFDNHEMKRLASFWRQNDVPARYLSPNRPKERDSMAYGLVMIKRNPVLPLPMLYEPSSEYFTHYGTYWLAI